MKRTVRGTLLVLLCGGCLLQSGCGILGAVIANVLGTQLFGAALNAIFPPQ